MSAFKPYPLPHPTGVELSRYLARLCQECGFAATGFAPNQPSRWGEYFRTWIAAGKHGEMDYLERDLELRDEPGKVYHRTRSFMVVADLYSPRGSVVPNRLGETPRPHARVARYAQGRNYHEEMKKRLHALSDRLRAEFPGCGFRTCVDTVPIFERELAVLAGLGWQARNTMLIHPKLGSYMLLGVVATSFELPPLPEQEIVTDHCGTCTRCIDACPTQAITPYKVDASRCISYLTIEHRDLIDPAFHEAMGDWMYGCDICQEVCPHNSARTLPSPPIQLGYTPRTQWFDVLEVLAWTAMDRQVALKASSMKRANLEMFRRNAAIAAGNALRQRPDPGLRAALEAQRTDPSPLVAGTINQVLGST
jgi:epoxyqueuosine reductase